MITPSCLTHGTSPQRDCVDCEDQFCADCAEQLTRTNSAPGMDVCGNCETRAQSDADTCSGVP